MPSLKEGLNFIDRTFIGVWPLFRPLPTLCSGEAENTRPGSLRAAAVELAVMWGRGHCRARVARPTESGTLLSPAHWVSGTDRDIWSER